MLLEAGADPNLTGMVPQRVSGGGEGATPSSEPYL